MSRLFSVPLIHIWVKGNIPHCTVIAIYKRKLFSSSNYHHTNFKSHLKCVVPSLSPPSSERIHLFQQLTKANHIRKWENGWHPSLTPALSQGKRNIIMFKECCLQLALLKHMVKCQRAARWDLINVPHYKSFIWAAVPEPPETLEKGAKGGALLSFSRKRYIYVEDLDHYSKTK